MTQWPASLKNGEAKPQCTSALAPTHYHSDQLHCASVCHSLCMPVRAPTLQCISVWLQIQCYYVHFPHRNNSTKPAHYSTIQSAKDSATQYCTVQHGTVLYLNNNGSSVSRVSRAERDLHLVWIWGRVIDLTMALVVLVAGDMEALLVRMSQCKTPDCGC